MSTLSFDFDVEKLVQALTYFASGNVHDLTRMKAAKLLYFLDKYHLLRYGRPVIGDVYYCLDHGPIPSASLNVLSDVIEDSDAEEGESSQTVEFVNRFLEVKRDGAYPHFTARRAFDPECFSASEIEALKATMARYGRCSAAELRRLSHQEPTWCIPNDGRTPGRRAPIPYELFFAGASAEESEVEELAFEEQEGRDFIRTLKQ